MRLTPRTRSPISLPRRPTPRIPIEVRGRGSKHEVGRPVQAGTVVSTENLVGVSLYEPTELVLSASAGTPIAEVQALLDERGQQLAFEPVDLGPVLGSPPGEGSIGGRLRHQPLRQPPYFGRRRARPSSRRRLRQWLGRAVQVGRPRDEKRHRLRSLQGGGRLLGDACGDHQRHHEGAAAARGDANHSLLRPPRPDRDRGDVPLPRHAIRGVGRRPP